MTARSREEGFTLIELMIVVSIIAILAGILIPNFVNARAQAMTAACESNLRSIATAAELYYADQQVYPASGDVTASLFTANGTGYLNNVPTDPAAATAGAAYAFANTTAGGVAGYTVTCPGVHANSTLAKLQGYSSSSSAIELHRRHGIEREVSEAYAVLGGSFATGLASSFGPCVAPRYLALKRNRRERERRGAGLLQCAPARSEDTSSTP